MHRRAWVACLVASGIAVAGFTACSGDGGATAPGEDAGDGRDGATASGDAATGSDGATGSDDGGSPGDGGGATGDASPDGGACTPLWGGSLTLPAQGVRSVTGWELVSPTSPIQAVTSLGGTSATDVWYAGNEPRLTQPETYFAVHYDGVSFRGLSSLPLPTTPVAVVSATEAWLGPEYRFANGVLAKSPASAPGKNAMKFFATNDGWSVGTGGVWHWNGATWTGYGTLGAVLPFTTVDGAGPSEVWAAAGPTVKRWNGTAWVDPPAPLPDGASVTALRVRAADDVWVTGSSTYHFDGVSWTAITSPGTKPLAMQSEGTATYVLYPGLVGLVQNGAIAYQNGNAPPCGITGSADTGLCRAAFLAPTGELFIGTGVQQGTYSPYARPAGAASSVTTTSLVRFLDTTQGPGETASLRQLGSGDTLAAHGGKLWRGSFGGTWTTLTPPRLSSIDTVVSVLGSRGDLVWVVSKYQTGTYYASIYDGTTFGPAVVLPSQPVMLRSNDKTSGDGRLFNGAPILFDGASWAAAPTTSGMYAMTSATDGFRLTGTVPNVSLERLVAGTWTAQPIAAAPGDYLSYVAALSPTDAVLLSRKGRVYRWNGASWSPPSLPFSAADIITEKTVYAGDGRLWVDDSQLDGTLATFDGACWQSEALPTGTGALQGSTERLWLGAYTGTPRILTRAPR